MCIRDRDINQLICKTDQTDHWSVKQKQDSFDYLTKIVYGRTYGAKSDDKLVFKNEGSVEN